MNSTTQGKHEMTEEKTVEALTQRVKELEKKISMYENTGTKTQIPVSFMEAAFETSPFSMWIADPGGTVIRTNRSLRETIKLPDDAILGKYNVLEDKNLEQSGVMPKVRAVFDRLEQTRFKIFWKAELAGEMDFSGARDMYIDVSMFPLLNGNNELEHVVCQWVDITDLKLTEKALRESEAQKKAILDASVDSIRLVDHEMRLIWANKIIEDMIQRDRKEIAGDFCYKVFTGRDRPCPDCPTIKSMKSGKIEHSIICEKDVKGINGTSYWADYAVPVKNENGRITGFIQVSRNITELKLAEQELKKREERFNLAMEFTNDGLFDWNLETGEIYYSPVWKRILGYEDHELPNDFSIWERLTDPEDVKRSWEMQTELINKKRDRFEIIFKMKHKDGHWVDILSRANAIFDQNNKAVRIVGTHVDISERKKLEKQLLQSQKLESIGNLAGGIAHEFNNILSIIIGNNELIMEDLPKWSLSRESAEEIRLAGLRARDIVKQLLTFSRQDHSAKRCIDIKSVVSESLKLIRATTPANIEIQNNIAPDCRPVFADETQINQILINLCNNSIDALPVSDGKIEITLCNFDIDERSLNPASPLSPGRYVKLQIRDNGSGMDKTILDRIFEPYFTTKEIGKGSGIGLAVVHGIVENHEGSIVCESSEDNGTVFTILIPAYEGLANEEPVREKLWMGNGEKILYVDDEPAIAQVGKRHLSRLGYDAFSTTDPKEALEWVKLQPERFDLVISDMAMPNMPGDRLIKEILAIRPDMPTIICTGYSSRISEANSSELGIKQYLMKPLDKVELARKIREVLDNTNRSEE